MRLQTRIQTAFSSAGERLTDLHRRYGIGMRIVKTALCVFICMVCADLVKQPPPFYACIAAVLCLQDTVENTVRFGINRLIATAVGGIVGIVLIFFTSTISYDLLYQVCVTIAVIVSLYICSIIKRQAAAVSCVVLLSITLNHVQDAPYIFALWRMAETAFGVVVAIVINRFIKPPKPKAEKQVPQDNIPTD